MKRQSQSVPNLNQENESVVTEEAEEEEGDKGVETKHNKKGKKKYKRLSKSFWNLFSASHSKEKVEKRSESSVTEKFVALAEEEEEGEEEKVDAALEDSLEDVKKVRWSICLVFCDSSQYRQAFSPGIRGGRREDRRGEYGGVVGGEEGADWEGAEGVEPAASGVRGKVVPKLQRVHQGGAPFHAGTAGRRHALKMPPKIFMHF